MEKAEKVHIKLTTFADTMGEATDEENMETAQLFSAYAEPIIVAENDDYDFEFAVKPQYMNGDDVTVTRPDDDEGDSDDDARLIELYRWRMNELFNDFSPVRA